MGYLYETHMHTSEVSGCATSSASEQAVAYINRGYTGIIVTDHFTNGYTKCPQNLPWEKKMKHLASGYLGAKKTGDKYGLDVFFGWEFTVRGSDFLTYGLDLDFLLEHPGLDRLDVEEYSTLVRECGGYLAQAHPYRDEYYVEYKFPVEPHLIDGVEVYNSMDRQDVNDKAFTFALEHNLPMQSGTDSHRTGNYNYKGIILQEKAESIHDIIKAIKTNNVVLA